MISKYFKMPYALFLNSMYDKLTNGERLIYSVLYSRYELSYNNPEFRDEEGYSGLSQALGALTNVLESLLNVIPGLGLSDLITILLENALPLENLIPTGYLEPHINNCTVENLGGTVGQNNTECNGGFVGLQIGTQMENCAIKNGEYIISAANYGGGFAGVERDAVVQGTLDGLGVDLLNFNEVVNKLTGMDNFQTESLLQECRIENSTVTINVGNYLGGFAGVMAASYAIDCDIKGTVSNPLTVRGTGSNIGGFAGDMQSGTVDNSTIATVDDSNNPKWTKTMQELYDPDAVNATGDLEKQFAVFNIDSVRGQTYGGGFAGKLRSGALAGSSGGISILGDSSLGIDITNLLGVINAYVPIVKRAGVYSENGFVVAADEIRSGDSHSGSAGGFAGYMSGAQISYCDVYRLKHTEVTPPEELPLIRPTLQRISFYGHQFPRLWIFYEANLSRTPYGTAVLRTTFGNLIYFYFNNIS